jgi:hypothetical protein
MPDKQLPPFFFYFHKSAIQPAQNYPIKNAFNPTLHTIQLTIDNHLQSDLGNPQLGISGTPKQYPVLYTVIFT